MGSVSKTARSDFMIITPWERRRNIAFSRENNVNYNYQSNRLGKYAVVTDCWRNDDRFSANKSRVGFFSTRSDHSVFGGFLKCHAVEKKMKNYRFVVGFSVDSRSVFSMRCRRIIRRFFKMSRGRKKKKWLTNDSSLLVFRISYYDARGRCKL